jgi:hypothetical protein
MAKAAQEDSPRLLDRDRVDLGVADVEVVPTGPPDAEEVSVPDLFATVDEDFGVTAPLAPADLDAMPLSVADVKGEVAVPLGLHSSRIVRSAGEVEDVFARSTSVLRVCPDMSDTPGATAAFGPAPLRVGPQARALP